MNTPVNNPCREQAVRYLQQHPKTNWYPMLCQRTASGLPEPEEVVMTAYTDEEVQTLLATVKQLHPEIKTAEDLVQYDLYAHYVENETLDRLLFDNTGDADLICRKINLTAPKYRVEMTAKLQRPDGSADSQTNLVYITPEEYQNLLIYQLTVPYFNFNRLMQTDPDLAMKLNSIMLCDGRLGQVTDPFVIVFDEIIADAEAIARGAV